MIRIHVMRDRYEHATNTDTISIIGHARPSKPGKGDPCSMVSAIVQSCIEALDGISKTYPRDVYLSYTGIRAVKPTDKKNKKKRRVR